MAICCVSKKIQTAHPRNTLRALDFFASLHLTIFERPENFEFFNSQSRWAADQAAHAAGLLDKPSPREEKRVTTYDYQGERHVFTHIDQTHKHQASAGIARPRAKLGRHSQPFSA
jgi:hypothetical protein